MHKWEFWLQTACSSLEIGFGVSRVGKIIPQFSKFGFLSNKLIDAGKEYLRLVLVPGRNKMGGSDKPWVFPPPSL